MAALVRAHDWAATPLGSIDDWPDRLKAAVETCLSSPLPTGISWGREFVTIYNDAARAVLGSKHAEAFARSMSAILPEAWEDARPIIERVLRTGAGAKSEDCLIWLDRGRGPEEASFTISFTALRDSSGDVAGLFVAAVETTEQRRSEERLRLALEVGRLATWDWDMKTGAYTWSDELYRLLGYSVGDVEPSFEAWAARVHPLDVPSSEAARARALEEHSEFDHEFRHQLPDGTSRWVWARAKFYYNAQREAVRMICVAQDITERRRWEDTQQILIAELQHRTRNLLAVVHSIAGQTLRASTSLDDFAREFHSRLASLSRVQALLSRDGGHSVTMDEVVRAELEAHGATVDGQRVVVSGAEVELSSKAVQVLALALHELATNAIKHGALSQTGARLQVMWRVDDANGARRLNISWSEQGVGLPPRPTAKRGFGRQLLERALPYDLGAETCFRFGADGVRCDVNVPLDENASRQRSSADQPEA